MNSVNQTFEPASIFRNKPGYPNSRKECYNGCCHCCFKGYPQGRKIHSHHSSNYQLFCNKRESISLKYLLCFFTVKIIYEILCCICTFASFEDGGGIKDGLMGILRYNKGEPVAEQIPSRVLNDKAFILQSIHLF